MFRLMLLLIFLFVLSGCATILNPNDKSYVLVRSDKIFVVDERGFLQVEQRKSGIGSLPTQIVNTQSESKEKPPELMPEAADNNKNSLYLPNGKMKPIKLVVSDATTSIGKDNKNSKIFTEDPLFKDSDIFKRPVSNMPVGNIFGVLDSVDSERANLGSIGAKSEAKREKSLKSIQELEDKIKSLKNELLREDSQG